MKYLLILGILLFFKPAYAQNCPTKPLGWQIRVNPSNDKMEAIGFKIWIGGSQDKSRFWMVWKKGMPLVFDVPIDLLYAKEIWVKVETLEEDKNLNMWTFYAGHSTKNWETDGNIDDETSQGDNGD